jgi:serine/threonine-protein kinase
MGGSPNTEGLDAGTRVLRYTILGKLAQGGMAEVYLAQQLGPAGYQKLVVVKRVRPQLASDPDFVAMFVNEARLAAMLNHPNVVQIFDLGQEGSDWYLAMEYLDGRDMLQLGRACRAQKKAVPFDVTARILADACAALDHAHQLSDAQGNSLNLVHRDMSPENILLTFNGMVKVVDFGIAKAADNIHQTQAGQIKGKLGYVAPEAILGKKLDGRADIFAVGATLYLFLCGRPAFSGKTPMEVFEKSLAPPKPPSEFNPRIPKALEAICMNCLAQDRETRYQTAAEVRTALESYLIGTKRAIGAAQLSQFMQYLFPADSDKVRARIDRMIAEGNAREKASTGASKKPFDDSATVSVSAPEPERSLPSLDEATVQALHPSGAPPASDPPPVELPTSPARKAAFGMRSLGLADDGDPTSATAGRAAPFGDAESANQPAASPVRSEELSVDVEVTAVSPPKRAEAAIPTSPGGSAPPQEAAPRRSFVDDEETVVNLELTEEPLSIPPPPLDSQAPSGEGIDQPLDVEIDMDMDMDMDVDVDITDEGIPPTAAGAASDLPLDLVSAMEVLPGQSENGQVHLEKTAAAPGPHIPEEALDVLDSLADIGDTLPPPPPAPISMESAPLGMPAEMDQGPLNTDAPGGLVTLSPTGSMPAVEPYSIPSTPPRRAGFGTRLLFFMFGALTGLGIVGGLLFAGGFIAPLMKRFGL